MTTSALGQAAALNPRGSIGCQDIRYSGSTEMRRSIGAGNSDTHEVGDAETARMFR